jgi:hypothetical protein
MLLGPANRITALTVGVVFASLLLVVVFYFAALRGGAKAGVFAAGLMFLTPVFQRSAGLVALDIPTAAFVLLTCLFLVRFLEHMQTQDALLFGIFASLSFLTKLSGYEWIYIVPMTLALLRRKDVFKALGFWLAACLVIILCGLWLWLGYPYWLSQKNLYVNLTLSASAIQYVTFLWVHCLLLFPLGLAGALVAWRHTRFKDPLLAVMVSLLPAGFFTIYFGRVPVQDRLMIPSFAALIVLSAWLWARLARSYPRLADGGATLILAGFAVLQWGNFPPGEPSRVQTPLRAILTLEKDTPSSILIPARSEPEWVSAVAQADAARPNRIIVRHTKYLVQEDWNGGRRKELFETVPAMRAQFDKAPIHFIVLDKEGRGAPYQSEVVLEEMVASDPGRWRQVFGSPNSGIRIFEDSTWSPRSETVLASESRRNLLRMTP